MSRKPLIFGIFAVVQLIMIISSAFRLHLSNMPRTNRMLANYAFITGSGDSYAFFCSVPNELQPEFLVTDSDGTVHHETLCPAGPWNHEAQLVFAGSSSLYGNATAETQPRYLRSWAAAMFERDPRAVKVNVKLKAYIVPEMADLPRGAEPQWVTVDSMDFQK